MPAASEAPGPHSETSGVAVPQTWRPLGARVVAGVASTALVGTVGGLWVALPSESRADFSVFQLITLVLVFGAVLVVLYGLFRTRARADRDGLTVVNGYHRHRLQWAEIVRVSFGRSRAWALLDLADGQTLAVMAIQNADGDRAIRQARQLAALVAHPPRP